ncbi:23S rRNA (adenine(1618)-N(6))-methyltransferase RlmF [Flavobacterium arcticum]|uniref:Ribosomal RNA large subunit methyltransferase F n=1 Tax=Flavobacterium arcticum TaxID=1784713 RepID=A0A345HBV2_9FLAO|nr:23S rRNA (adenine(1618)-N(6))-methyltransferase RlmF [Flavobacterium arcticum]AXG74062.1 23S rRNA (adenine(1618)-N(6))-methyltransferase RlmF [Flavobacterium arcticum]KAF2507377.1 23S rRNA (adenine(1618)-N(6))-methyltransferase RlmF [Flavobacterium arcticum]
MSSEKKQEEKGRLHLRNRNRERYDLDALLIATPELSNYVKPNKFGVDSVDFSNPVAVKLLNTALLSHYYGIKSWEFPDENLCPPIPGRADYIHYIADLLCESNFGRLPHGNKITCLDVGVGASCIYPILGVTEYNWNFIGADINENSIASAQNIINNNVQLSNKIELRLQKSSKDIFYGIIALEDKIDMTLCNPPFHASAEEAQKGTLRKVKNLSGKPIKTPELNFAGISNELICDGGEHQFIHNMIRESKKFAANCFWFSTLVSKQSNLKGIYKALDAIGATDVKTIPMGTGNKSTRIVAWTLLSKEEQKEWKATKWKK